MPGSGEQTTNDTSKKVSEKTASGNDSALQLEEIKPESKDPLANIKFSRPVGSRHKHALETSVDSDITDNILDTSDTSSESKFGYADRLYQKLMYSIFVFISTGTQKEFDM